MFPAPAAVSTWIAPASVTLSRKRISWFVDKTFAARVIPPSAFTSTPPVEPPPVALSCWLIVAAPVWLRVICPPPEEICCEFVNVVPALENDPPPVLAPNPPMDTAPVCALISTSPPSVTMIPFTKEKLTPLLVTLPVLVSNWLLTVTSPPALMTIFSPSLPAPWIFWLFWKLRTALKVSVTSPFSRLDAEMASTTVMSPLPPVPTLVSIVTLAPAFRAVVIVPVDAIAGLSASLSGLKTLGFPPPKAPFEVATFRISTSVGSKSHSPASPAGAPAATVPKISR